MSPTHVRGRAVSPCVKSTLHCWGLVFRRRAWRRGEARRGRRPVPVRWEQGGQWAGHAGPRSPRDAQIQRPLNPPTPRAAICSQHVLPITCCLPLGMRASKRGKENMARGVLFLRKPRAHIKNALFRGFLYLQGRDRVRLEVLDSARSPVGLCPHSRAMSNSSARVAATRQGLGSSTP